MDSVTDSLVHLTRNLIDIDSTSGRELEATTWLATWLRERNYHVIEQPVADNRVNIIATIDTNSPEVIFSTHIDCVPPFFPSRVESDLLFGRGACDAKGILAAELTALELLRARGENRVGLLVVVGEENGSHGARAANSFEQACRHLINGEPTDNRLASATRGVYRVRLASAGLAAHSSNPELGNSAIEKLIDALVELRKIDLPSDKILGRTSYTVGMISGGVAPNVVPPFAEADVNFRTVGAVPEVRSCLGVLADKVAIEDLMIVPPVRLITFPEFATEVFRFTTDIPFLTAWGQPLLIGPGSVKVAHTDTEHVAIPELVQAVDLYQRLALRLLA